MKTKKTQKIQKLKVKESTRLHLLELNEILSKKVFSDEHLSKVFGSDGCGAMCQITCSYWCRAECVTECRTNCVSSCRDVCKGLFLDPPPCGEQHMILM